MPSHRSKHAKREKDGEEEQQGWVCSVCTRLNEPGAFKCDTCDVRKGTSTRKPRLNSTVMEQQETIQKFVQQQQAAALASARGGSTRVKRDSFSISSSPLSSIEEHDADSLPGSPSTSSKRNLPVPSSSSPAHLQPNLKYIKQSIDKNSARTVTVTVGDVTVAITDYKINGLDRSVSAPASASSSGDRARSPQPAELVAAATPKSQSPSPNVQTPVAS